MSAAQGFPAFAPRPGRRGRSWWARAFVAAMEDTALDAGLLRRGRRFAASGRIGPITVSPGRIAAVVEDPDGIYDVVVHLTELTGPEWDRFLDQVTAEAGHLAALLDGEVPRSLVRSADAADVSLLPTVGDLESVCGCPDIGDPCQHAAALCYQTAWLLDDDPFVLLLLRGRSSEELLDVLGRGRTGGAGTPAGPQVPSGADDGTRRPVAAAAAYAIPARPIPPTPQALPPATEAGLPEAPGLPPDALALLVSDAASRARALLGQPDQSPVRTEWADAIRWAATHPETAERVAGWAGRDIGAAVQAWELDGAPGLAALEPFDRDERTSDAPAQGLSEQRWRSADRTT